MPKSQRVMGGDHAIPIERKIFEATLIKLWRQKSNIIAPLTQLTVPIQMRELVTVSAILLASWIAKDVVAFAPSPRVLWKSSRLSMSAETNEAKVCLETLEKRIKEGPDSLSSSEVSDLKAAMLRIEDYVDVLKIQEDSAAADDDDQSTGGSLEEQLYQAATQMDGHAVTKLLESGNVEMDDDTTNAAFWAVVNAVDTAEAADQPLSENVPIMLHHIFDADHKLLLKREKQTTNVTCMQPDDSVGVGGAARRMNYIFDDSAHKDLPLKEGRCCEGGDCCDACSRNFFPTFALTPESDLETFPELASFTFNNLEKVSAKTILQFVRLIERVRRTIAHEYGLPLSTILPLQAYSRKYVAGTTQKGGGGGEGDFVTLHTDEATHSGYHYSCVLYLSTQGEDFEGGSFVFNDPDPDAQTEAEMEAQKSDEENEALKALEQKILNGEELPEDDMVIEVADEDEDAYISLSDEIRKAGRKMTPFAPTRGAAAIFSSGWENMHEVEKITSGIRYAVPCFFTTCPVPQAHYDQMKVGKPKTDEDIADDWLHLLLAHRKEEPMESVGRVKELLMKWHCLCSPLSMH
ncbi:2-oxoglutarate and iron-dependent oxygenase domain containing 3 [Seminavis robusta]|uniref:2-oxoglutarate and iron-dependent oxygenase domain containing 3 n=1 Tax=Seminavis robusta TaxID=568900 RepID=A0A9N8E328_9STRA|nr:2-oxoglutarate and iron-dependent oxygenase domain containing 3 [Seminavis robusta]|eukprot:Sro606_g174450.1 2-oxoglutarate and iron-dependent oxygenase domain containing 3 (577) ;mRNA; r:12097-13827